MDKKNSDISPDTFIALEDWNDSISYIKRHNSFTVLTDEGENVCLPVFMAAVKRVPDIALDETYVVDELLSTCGKSACVGIKFYIPKTVHESNPYFIFNYSKNGKDGFIWFERSQGKYDVFDGESCMITLPRNWMNTSLDQFLRENEYDDFKSNPYYTQDHNKIVWYKYFNKETMLKEQSRTM